MIKTSEFINDSIEIDKAELLKNNSSTANTYKLRMNGRLYFMKQLRPEYKNDPRYRALFFKEYENGKAIKHPYVVEYTSINENEDGLYIIMEYVNGTSLREKIEHEPNFFESKENIYKMLTQLLEALKTLHNRNIIYLDLSPNNILLTKTTNDIKLIDLGFCICDSNDSTGGYTKGFSAPETQDNTPDKLDARTDIYGVGCLLQYIEKETGKKLPRKLQRIKKRCMQPQKEKRYTTVDKILSEIKNQKRDTLCKIAATTIIATTLFAGLKATGIYENITDYIAWESGKIADKFEENGIFYQITNKKARTVEVSYKGTHPDEFEYEYKGGKIKIPATVTHRGRTFRTTGIAGQAFKNPYISKIEIPEGIISISDSAFFGCLLNDTIYIPKSVTKIGHLAIYPACYIKGFVVDAENPFYDSRNNSNALIETASNTLVCGCENAIIPDKITSIAAGAFLGVENLDSINIPASVTEIGDFAFVRTKIKKIALPEGITELKRYTFQYCESLQKIELPESLNKIGLGALSHCAFNEVVIPERVTIIDDYAFDCNERLEKVTIGRSVRNIGYAAFENCSKLKTIISHIPADSLFEIDRSTFNNIDKNCTLYVPIGAKSQYKKTFGWDCFNHVIELE